MTAPQYAHAFPGAIFMIPCDREMTSPSDPAQLMSPTSGADTGTPPHLLTPMQSTRNQMKSLSSVSSYAFSSPHGSSFSTATSDSPGPKMETWGRPPQTTNLSPMINLVSPWSIEDAKAVFGERLRFGDSIRPDTPPAQEDWSVDTSTPPSSSPSESHDSCMEENATSPSVTAAWNVQGGSGLVMAAPVVRPEVVRNDRVLGLMKAAGLNVQTQF